MSSSAARRLNPASPRSRQSRPKLRLVDARVLRASARRRAISLVAMLSLAAGMFLVAFAHAQLVGTQQRLDQIRSQVAEAEAERARLERDVVFASSPESIVVRATALGMVRATDPQYLVAVRPSADS